MKRLLIDLRWCAVTAGYLIRPYDMLEDRRRWFWQSRTYCSRYPR